MLCKKLNYYCKTVSTLGEYACIHSYVILLNESHEKQICAWLLNINNVVQKINLVL